MIKGRPLEGNWFPTALSLASGSWRDPETAEAGNQPELHTFAAGIRMDIDGVTAGLTLPSGSRATEGDINRVMAVQQSGPRLLPWPPGQCP